MDGTTQIGVPFNIYPSFMPQAQAYCNPVWLTEANVSQGEHGKAIDLTDFFARDIYLDHPTLDRLLESLLDQVGSVITFFNRLTDMLGSYEIHPIQPGIITGFT